MSVHTKDFLCFFWEVSHHALDHRFDEVFHIPFFIQERIVDHMVASFSRSISPPEDAMIHQPIHDDSLARDFRYCLEWWFPVCGSRFGHNGIEFVHRRGLDIL